MGEAGMIESVWSRYDGTRALLRGGTCHSRTLSLKNGFALLSRGIPGRWRRLGRNSSAGRASHS